MSKELKYSLIIAVTYCLFGVLWILFSDAAVASIAKDAATFHRISNYKGLAYVTVSAILIFVLVLTYYKRYVSYQAKYTEIHKEDDRIFQELPIGATVLSLDGKVIKVNKALCRLLDFTEEEFKNLTGDFFNPRQTTEGSLMKRVLQYPDLPCYENIQLQKAGGKKIWCEVNCILIRDTKNNNKYFIINVQDIDREFRMQQRMVKLNQELLDAQRLGKFGHWHYRFDTQRINLSEQSAEILTTKSLSPSRSEVLTMFDENSKNDFVNQLELISKQGGRLHSIASLKRPGIGHKFIEVEAEMTIDEADGSIVLKGTLKDVSQVMSLLYEKENFNKSLVNWAFKLSHELRKPISSILGLAQLMQENLVQQHERETLNEHLKTAAAELDEQTRDLSEQFHYMQNMLNDNPLTAFNNSQLYVLSNGKLDPKSNNFPEID